MSDILVHQSHGIDDGFVVIFFGLDWLLRTGVDCEAYFRDGEIVVVVIVARVTRTGGLASRRGREGNGALTDRSMVVARGQRRTRLSVGLWCGLIEREREQSEHGE